MRNKLGDYIQCITLPNQEIGKQMEAYIDGLTKPVGALGKLEDLMIQLASIQERLDVKTQPKVSIIMCADNGVCEEGVSSCPQEVTLAVTENFTKGITAMNKLSEFAHADMHVVDIGVKGEIGVEKVVKRKVMEGTRNMTKGPAMTESETLQAIWVGIEETEKLIQEGYMLFGTGEMGIGNTTTSAAITSVLLRQPIETVTGRGAGALDCVYHNKIQAIQQAIKYNAPDADDAVDVLSKVGGLDIAGLVGVYLACAYHRRMVVIDGFIAATAALVAYKLCPSTKYYMVASHLSKEEGVNGILEAIGVTPHVDLHMRLGEGSGCPILFQIIEMARYTLLGMGTFEDAGVDKKNYEHIWK